MGARDGLDLAEGEVIGDLHHPLTLTDSLPRSVRGNEVRGRKAAQMRVGAQVFGHLPSPTQGPN